MYFPAKTIDDLLNAVLRHIIDNGESVNPTKGANREVFGAALMLENPRARLSQTQSRGKAFSAIGEFLWYLSGTNQLDFIEYYLPSYNVYSDDGKTVHGGYGSRLFGEKSGINQIENIVNMLKNKPSSRQAVIQIFESSDIAKPHKDVPCTCTMQFVIRDDKLKMAVHMRSNDVYIGLPHDIFSFTMLQELIARELGVELGTYHHMVGSIHLYDKDRDKAESYLKEGFQSLEVAMPELPLGPQWEQIEFVMELEKQLREEQSINMECYNSLNEYWKDIVLLLQIHAKFQADDIESVFYLNQELNYDGYRTFVEDKIRRINIVNGKDN